MSVRVRGFELAKLRRNRLFFTKIESLQVETDYVAERGITKYILVFCPTGFRRYAPKFKIDPYDFVEHGF